MARPSRARRGNYQAPATPSRRRRDRQPQHKPAQQTKSQAGAQRERRGGFRTFVGESAAELRKVDWPGQRQLFMGTIVVLIAIAVVGAYLAAADFVFSRFVQDVLLRGI